MFDVKSHDTTVTRIARRTRGQSHGPITRLMSPSDFGRLLKPFVFLDLIDNQGKPFSGFGLHPHSGIATLTYVAEGSVRYEDTNGATGLLRAGGIEWMQAGGGVWLLIFVALAASDIPARRATRIDPTAALRFG